MPLPANWSTVTVTGKFLAIDGTPLKGSVYFSSTVRLIDGAATVIIPASANRVHLDNDGGFSVTLPATDDPDVAPQFYYQVDEDLTLPNGQRASSQYLIQLPAANPAVDLSDLAPATSLEQVSPYARLAAENVFTKPLTLQSSFAGGEDEGQPGQFDSTSRLNLESYQRADVGSYGETVRHFLMRKDAKAMEAWYFPAGGYDANREPVGAMKPVVWAGAHWEANNHASNHKHWSVETPDSTGAIQTRFEVRWGNPLIDGAIAGLDKTMIATNLADFVVRCTNGQELRLSAPVGQEKGLTFSHDAEGADQYRRWRIRVTSDAEPGTGSGSNFAVSRYDDAGTFVDSPIYVTRSNGRVGFGVTDPAVRLDIGDDRIRIRQSRTPATATSFGNQGDIAWDANYVYVCVAPSQWKRTALASW